MIKQIPKSILITIIMGIIGIYFSRMAVMGNHSYLFLIIGIIYVIIFIKKPELILLISAVLITNMFALFPEDFLRIKGIFKLRDLLLLSPIPIIIIKETVEKENLKYILKSIFSKAIICFCSFVFLIVIITVIKFSYSINLSIRIARDYFYYIFYFTTVYSITTKKQLNWYIRSLILLSLIFSIMYSILAISGGTINPFPAYYAKRSTIWGVSLARGYVSFGFAYTMCIALIPLLGIIKERKKTISLMIAIIILLMAIFFSLGRGGWYGLLISIIIITLVVPNKKLFLSRLSIIGGTLLMLLIIIGKVRYGMPTILIKGGRSRFYSGVEELREKKGTFEFRKNYFSRAIKYAMKKNLLFGIGFLYPETKEAKFFPWMAVTFSDIGLLCIMATMGIFGTIIYLLLYIIFIARSIDIFKKIKNPIYKGIIIGFVVAYINGWIGSIVGQSIASFINITVYAMCLGLTEVMYRVENE